MNWHKIKDCIPGHIPEPNIVAVVYTDGKGIHISWDAGFICLARDTWEASDWPIAMRTFPAGERYLGRTSEVTHWTYLYEMEFELPLGV